MQNLQSDWVDLQLSNMSEWLLPFRFFVHGMLFTLLILLLSIDVHLLPSRILFYGIQLSELFIKLPELYQWNRLRDLCLWVYSEY